VRYLRCTPSGSTARIERHSWRLFSVVICAECVSLFGFNVQSDIFAVMMVARRVECILHLHFKLER